MSRELAVILTLVAYKVILIAIGVLSAKKNRGSADFFIGGKSLGPWVAAISAAASSSSVWTLLGVSGAAYAKGLSAIWIFPGCVGGFLINWTFLAPRLRRLSHSSDALTVTDLLTGPRGTPLKKITSTFASAIVLFSFAFYVASQYQGAGKTFSATFGLDVSTSIYLGAGIILIYTLLGGFWAVSITDTLQGLVMALASVLLPIVAIEHVGGIGALWEGIQQVDAVGFSSLTGDAPLMASIGVILGLLGIGLGYPGQPHVVNRLMALKDEDSMRQGRRIAIGWAVLVYAGMLIVGWAGRVAFAGLLDNEQVFITATNQLFPPVLAGIILAGALSAMMSTADSQLLVAASAVTHDMRLGGPTESSMIFRSRLVIAALSAGAVVLAINGTPEIFSKVLFAWSALGSAFGPLLLVRIFRPIRPGAVLLAMTLGFSTSVFFYSLGDSAAIERIVPFGLALAIAWLGSRRESPQSH